MTYQGQSCGQVDQSRCCSFPGTEILETVWNVAIAVALGTVLVIHDVSFHTRIGTTNWKKNFTSSVPYCDMIICHTLWHILTSSYLILFGRVCGILSDIVFWHSLWHGHCHWDLALAVEVQQCPLRSGARSWRLAVLTAIWSSLLGGRKARKDGMRK